MADSDRDDDVTDDASEDPASEFVDLTTPANQGWLDEPSSWTPIRLLEDEEAIEQRRQKVNEAYRAVVGEEPDE